jgi:hypothetical protein
MIVRKVSIDFFGLGRTHSCTLEYICKELCRADYPSQENMIVVAASLLIRYSAPDRSPKGDKPMTNFFRATLAGVALAAATAVVPVLAETMSFKADLKSGPGISSEGTGNLTATYDTETRKLSWKGNVSRLTGDVIAAHFHGPAEPGQNAGVLIPAAGVKAGDFAGSATLTNDQAKVVTAEKTYFMVHTPANPGGEVRGQVVKGQ